MFERSPIAGAAFASMIAGPVFLTAWALELAYLTLPQPVVVSPGDVGVFLLLLFPASLVGIVLAFIPNIVGSVGLTMLAERHAFARLPAVWVLTGAGAAGTVPLLYDQIGAVGFSFAVTGAVCARISRAYSLPD